MCDDIRFIIGPGLDEVLGPGDRLVILDEYYADVYGDYVFAGYDVLQTSISTSYSDLVGLHNAAILLKSGSVVVCGSDPLNCVLAYAARRVLKGEGWSVALRESWRCLSRIYQERSSLAVPRELTDALAALEKLVKIVGEKVSLLISLAANYEYGRGGRFYGELVTWLSNLNVGSGVLLAGALAFLAESLH